MTKVFDPFFFVSSGLTNIEKAIMGVQKKFWQPLWNLKEPFLRPKWLLKTQSVERKGNLSKE